MSHEKDGDCRVYEGVRGIQQRVSEEYDREKQRNVMERNRGIRWKASGCMGVTEEYD